jgi:hypothetical protein
MKKHEMQKSIGFRFSRRGWISRLAGLFTICLAVASLGCGYQLRASGEPLGITIESLAIPLVESSSSNLGFEADFTSVIRNEFISRSRVPLLPLDKAHMSLIGNVYEIRTDPLSFDTREVEVIGTTATYSTTNSRRLTVKLDMKLVERKSGKVIWHDRSMEEKATFAVGKEPLTNRDNEKRALETISRSLAVRIYNRTMDRF